MRISSKQLCVFLFNLIFLFVLNSTWQKCDVWNRRLSSKKYTSYPLWTGAFFFFHQLLTKTDTQSLLFLPTSERRARRGDGGRTPVARERLRVSLKSSSFISTRIRLAFQVSKWETRMLKCKLAVGHRRIIASWISMSFSFHLSELVDLY